MRKSNRRLQPGARLRSGDCRKGRENKNVRRELCSGISTACTRLLHPRFHVAPRRSLATKEKKRESALSREERGGARLLQTIRCAGTTLTTR